MNDQPKTGPVPAKTQWQAQQPVQTQQQVVRPEVDENRERQPREEQHQEERRRRKGSTLNRMVQFKLDFIPPEALDLDRYVYRWVNDEPGRIRMATKHDDYDYVKISELKGVDPEGFDSEGGETVRMLSGQDKFGNPQYTYLLKKRREFWEADNEEVVRNREDMMAGRVYRGEMGDSFNGRDEIKDGNYDNSNYYTSRDSQIGGAAERRKGPLPKRVIR